MIITPTALKMVKCPCGICQKDVPTKHKAICCDLCNKWTHIDCNSLNKTTYIQIQPVIQLGCLCLFKERSSL